MAIQATTYIKMIQSAFEGEIDFVGSTLKCALFNSSYSPEATTNRYFSDLTGEVNGEGYVAGGTTVPNATLNYSNGKWVFNCGDPEWEDATIQDIRYIVFYVDSGLKPLIGYFDLNSGRNVENGIFRPVIHEDGLMSIEVTS